jgi:hypothetical protein
VSQFAVHPLILSEPEQEKRVCIKLTACRCRRARMKIRAQRLIDVGRSSKQAPSVNDGTYHPAQTFPFKRRAFILKSRMP